MSLVHFFVTLAVLGLDVSVGSRVGCKEGWLGGFVGVDVILPSRVDLGY